MAHDGHGSMVEFFRLGLEIRNPFPVQQFATGLCVFQWHISSPLPCFFPAVEGNVKKTTNTTGHVFYFPGGTRIQRMCQPFVRGPGLSATLGGLLRPIQDGQRRGRGFSRGKGAGRGRGARAKPGRGARDVSGCFAVLWFLLLLSEM